MTTRTKAAPPDPAISAGEHRIGDAFVVRQGDGGAASIHCASCDHEYGPVDVDPKLGAVVREGGIDELSPLNAYGLTDTLVVRHFYCPSCALAIAVDVQKRDDPILLGNRLKA